MLLGARGQCASGRPFPHLDNVQVTLRGGHIEGSLRAALHAVSREPAHHVQVSPPPPPRPSLPPCTSPLDG